MNKKLFNTFSNLCKCSLALAFGLSMIGTGVSAQDSTTAPPLKTKKYIKNTFEGNYLIDEQTVMVPVKGTLEFDIQHRFGTINNNFTDLFGIFAGANMRIGASYVPIKNLQVGAGANNDRMMVDGTVKYALIKQTKNEAVPFSLTLYGNAAMDTRKRNSSLAIVQFSDRLSYFSQVIIARKITPKLSVQVAPNLSYFNNVPAYYDDKGNIQPAMNNAHFAIAYGGRYKLTETMSFLLNFDQPLTQHPMYNPHPNVSFGLEMKTSGHAFQIFATNYGYLIPQINNVQNQNDYANSRYLIGFNISRLWNL